jgi:hypothetical protein
LGVDAGEDRDGADAPGGDGIPLAHDERSSYTVLGLEVLGD